MESQDGTRANVERIKKLFPNVITEVRGEDGEVREGIDFELLRQELSPDVVDGEERYEFTWVGKRECIVEGNRPIRKTLRPVMQESKDWENTQNLYIEGDNLDVLKLLQESYLGKVKMIYIDPPYNTGKDFIYKDDYAMDQEEYEDKIELFDEEDHRLFRNTESNGRFHSDWCSMMYPRLKLARTLLSEDGVIFISIDDNEISSLKNISDEVFGETNLIGIFKWNRTSKAPTLSPKLRGKYEYILCYEKADAIRLRGPDSYNEAAPLFNSGNPISEILFPVKSVDFLFADGTYRKGKYGKGNKKVELHDEILVKNQKNINEFRISARFKWSQETIDSRIQAGQKLFFKTPKFTTMYYALETGEDKFIAPSDLLSQEECGVLRNDDGCSEIKKLFDDFIVFDYVKPISLLKYLVRMVNDTNFLAMDFFSGSATTAHAVMQLNAEDGGNRKFIMVQLPEICEETSEAYKAGYKTISDIGKERIRRAGEKIREEIQSSNKQLKLGEEPKKVPDIGFRVLKVDSTNMKDVYYSPMEIKQSALSSLASNIKEDRTDLDLLYGVLLEWGLPLSGKHSMEELEGVRVHTVEDGALIACFQEKVPESVVRTIAKRKPLRAVFRDDCFATSPEKINLLEIFKELAPDTSVKVL